MKKFELSEMNSNLLLFTSVAFALTPFLLGEQLYPLVDSFVRYGVIEVSQFWSYLGGLLS